MATMAASMERENEAVPGVERLLGLARRRAGLILGCAALTTALSFVTVTLQTPVFRATVELLVDPQSLQVVGRDIVRTDTSASLDFASVDSQALVITSTAVLRQVIDRLDLADDPAFQVQPGRLGRLFGAQPVTSAEGRIAEALNILRQDVVVHRVDASLVLQVTVSDPDARRAADIANALAAAYLRQVAQERVDAVERSNASLVGQVAELRAELDKAEAAVETFRSANGLIRTSDTGLAVTQQLKDLYTQIDAAAATVAQLAARKDQLGKAGPEALLTDAVPEAMTSATIIALRGQYAQSARELASLSQTLLPQHPRVQEVRAELAETQKLLKAEFVRIRASVATAYAQAVANLANLKARAKTLTGDKVASSEAEIRLRQLESEADAIRSVFNASLSRARELDQQGKIATSNSRVLSDAAVPLKASKPPLAIVLAAAALFGACAGLGLAYLAEMLPRRIRPQRLTARHAGALLGVGTAVTQPTAAGLEAVARTLRERVGGSLPAVVTVAGVPDVARTGRLCDALGQALADLGEEVLVCDMRRGLDGIEVRRVAARGRRATGSGGPRRGAIHASAGGVNAMARGEFFIAPANAPGSPAAMADAIVLAVDLARTSPDALAGAAQALDPGGRLIAAVVALDGGTAEVSAPGAVTRAAA